jgi:hypothetical protein
MRYYWGIQLIGATRLGIQLTTQVRYSTNWVGATLSDSTK